jgi:hypothetical protein
MKQSEMYSIAVENEDIVIRLNGDLVDQDVLTKFLDYIELESIRKRSKLTEEQASALAEEVGRSAWDSTKQKFTEK